MPRIDYVVVVWSMIAASGLTLAAVHLMAWMTERRRVSLAFVSLSACVATIALLELSLMRAPDAEVYASTLRWAHLPILALVLSVVAFVRASFPGQRNWLAALVVVSRVAAVVANFFSGGANLNFKVVTGLHASTLFGSPIVVPEGITNPWARLGELATLLLLVYIVDSAWRHARHGPPHARTSAFLIGGGTAVFVGGAAVLAIAVNQRLLAIPYMISLPYLGVAMVMAWQLSREMVRATRLARELSDSERRAQLAARGARAGLWRWQHGEKLMWADAAARALHGMVGENARVELDDYLARVESADRDRLRAVFGRGSSTEFEVEYLVLVPGSGHRWLRSRGAIERDAQGRAIIVQGGSIDVSDRREAEQRFRSVVESAPTALFVVAPEGTIMLANRRAEDMFGARAGELVGRPVTDIASIGKPRGSEIARASGLHERRARRVDGSEFTVEVGISELPAPGGTQFLASMVDVTMRLEHEREMQRLREQFANASRMSLAGQLASTLAHELSQPLAAILRNAETAGILLERPEPDLAELEAIIDDIRSDDRRAGDIIDHMRSLLQGRGPVLSAVAVPEMLGRVAAVVRHDADLRQVKVTVESEVVVPEVHADPVQLQQVLLNLVYNSLHALDGVAPDARSIGLHVRAVNEGVEVAVSDTGPGLAPGALPRLFDPFYSTKPDGMGMGLAICRTLVDAMGGRIDAGNAMGGGAVFRIALQRADVTA